MCPGTEFCQVKVQKPEMLPQSLRNSRVVFGVRLKARKGPDHYLRVVSREDVMTRHRPSSSGSVDTVALPFTGRT